MSTRTFTVTDSLRERFLAKVAKGDEGDCWKWTGGSRGVGYGAVKIEGRAYDAHRVSYVIHKGAIPEGMVVMHTCDNRACVNPSHLELGSYRDNAKDASDKGRLSGFVRRTPLTDDEMRAMWEESSRGISNRQLAGKYKVPMTSVARILGRADSMFATSPTR